MNALTFFYYKTSGSGMNRKKSKKKPKKVKIICAVDFVEV